MALFWCKSMFMRYREKEKLIVPSDIEAVLFDLDGTLVDSMWMWPEIDRDFLNERGFDVPSDLKNDIDGLSILEDAVYFKKRFNLPETHQQLIDIWNEMALEHYESDVPLKKGARDFLRFLRRKGIMTGLVTSNSRILCDAALNSNDVADLFDTIVSAEDVSHGKPDPEGYLTAANRLAVTPHECMVCEDLTVGLIAAKEAGMMAVAIEDDYSKDEEDEKNEYADIMIPDFTELMG